MFSNFKRTNLLLELALKQSSNSNKSCNKKDEEKGCNPDPNYGTSNEDALCEVPPHTNLVPAVGSYILATNGDDNNCLVIEPNDQPACNPDPNHVTSNEDALYEVTPDTNLIPAMGNYILVTKGDDNNCLVLEPDQLGLLPEIGIVNGKIADQQETELNIEEDGLLSSFNISLDENYLNLDILSNVQVEDSVAQVEDNNVLINEHKNEQETKNGKEMKRRPRDDDEEESDVSEKIFSEEIDHSYSKEIPLKRKRAKRGKANKELWIANENKRKRSHGQEYFGRRKTEEGKIVFDIKRPKKIMKRRCSCPAKNLRNFGCAKISDRMRENIFKQFYSLNKGEKQVFIKGLVDKRPVAQRTIEVADTSRRNYSFLYYLKPDDEVNERIKVCKRMFLATFSIGEWAVHEWVSKASDLGNSENIETNGADNEENTEAKGKRKEKKTSLRPTQVSEERKLVLAFFDSLPKLESHYCRKSTTKLYLEPKWQSKAELFRLYKIFCKSENKESLVTSIFTFHSVFDECNLALFSPKKDQCDTCCAHKTGNLSEQEYTEHIKRKDQAREQKEHDKKSTDEKTSVFTMDLQAVLLCPSLKASALYYRTKLKVHNFTLYNLKTGAGYCYLWDETEGELNADEFASIMYHFLTNEVNKETCNHIILYSDGCTYQNRNVILANTFLLASKKLDIVITQKFLEKGHTQMECDSMHSCIERRLKNREIYSPVAYSEACRTARLHPAPYKVQYLQHSFFKKFSDLQFVSSIRPGQKKGDPVVTNLKCIKYTTDGNIQVKLDFQDEFSNLQRRIKYPSSETEIKSLRKKKVPLQAIKFKHLQQMKSVLPRQVHIYYDTLPHLSNSGNKLCERETCTCIIPVNVDF